MNSKLFLSLSVRLGLVLLSVAGGCFADTSESIPERKKLFTKTLTSVGIKGTTTKQLKRVGIETIPTRMACVS